MSLTARRFRAVVGWPLVALAVVLVGCATGLTDLTSEQARGLTEAQRIADQVTKGYGVPAVRVYPISLGPSTAGRYLYHQNWIYIRPEFLTGFRLPVVMSHELGHVTLDHRPMDTTAERAPAAVERERAANRRGVEILVKYLGLTEQEALDQYARYFIGANRLRHGQDVLLPFGHLRPCEELRELWTGFGKTAPPCEDVTAAPSK